MKQFVYHHFHKDGKRIASHPILKGMSTLLNLSGRSRVYDEYMRGNIMTDYQKDTMALRKDGMIAMSHFEMSIQ